jgi:precorrin-6A/cobalt-precorrin-6A reductase
MSLLPTAMEKLLPMLNRRILILGGTSDAIALARALSAAGYDIITSLAGVTENPKLPEGQTRVGGFGGEEGLFDYLRNENIMLVADATHPFAAQISTHGFSAARRAGIKYIRLEREAWVPLANDHWIDVADFAQAEAALPKSARVLLTIGRKEILPFIARSDLSGIARMIEPPADNLPSHWNLVLARPPFELETELELLKQNNITHLVTKNAGGKLTSAKLIAAREIGIPVIMIARPDKPETGVFRSPQALLASVNALD